MSRIFSRMENRFTFLANQYVGETEQLFNKRMKGHRNYNTCKTDFPISRHLKSHEHEHAQADLKKNLTIIILNHIEGCSKANRRTRESFWIRKLRIVYPREFGLKTQNETLTLLVSCNYALLQDSHSLRELISPPELTSILKKKLPAY